MARQANRSRFRHWNHRRIDFFRLLKLRLTYLVCRPFQRWTAETGRSYLVFRLDDKLGDSVTSTGFLKKLKQQSQDTVVSVVAGPALSSFYRSLDFIDVVYESKKGFFSTLKLYFKMRSQKFDYIINTSHILNPRTVFLVSHLRGYRKIGFENFGYRIFSDFINIDFKKGHVTSRYKAVLQFLGISSDDQDLSYAVTVSEADRAAVKPTLSSLRTKYRYLVALNSFAGGRLRNFNQTTTLTLVRELTRAGDTAVISVANAGDHRILSKWNKGDVHAWSHYPEFADLGHNLALVEGCDMIVTPDTAWVHLASALKKKIVAVYRPDRNPSEVNSVIWAPYGLGAKVIFADTKRHAEDDINYVSVEKIAQSAKDLLLS